MKIKRFLMVILGCGLCALSFNIFLSPYHILPGGVSGISIVLKYLFDFNESMTILLLSILLLVISLIFLGKESTFKSIIGSLLYPVFVYLTELLLGYFDLTLDNRLLASIIGGVIFGLGIGIVYKEGYTTGGTDILSKIFHQFLHLSFGTATLIIDGIITLVGTIVFGFETLVYSLIAIYVISIVIDKVILGLFGNKSFYIITKEPEKIKEYVLNELGHGATILDGRGAYSKDVKYLVFTVIPTRDYYKLRDSLKQLNQEAFFIVSDSYEVGGGK